jgi:hypothetical protein
MSPKALYVPVDTNQPVQEIEVNGFNDIRDRVGGLPEQFRCDIDLLLFRNYTGSVGGLPLNPRATDYMKAESVAAHVGGIQNAVYDIYGDAVITSDVIMYGELNTDVPERLIERFADPHLHTHIPRLNSPEQSADMDIGF